MATYEKTDDTHLIQDINENKIHCPEIQLPQQAFLQDHSRDRLGVVIGVVDEWRRIADFHW